MNIKISVLCSSIVISGVIIFSALDLGENKPSSIFSRNDSVKSIPKQDAVSDTSDTYAGIEEVTKQSELDISTAEKDLLNFKLNISKSKAQLDETAKNEVLMQEDPDEILKEAKILLAKLKDDGVNVIGSEYEYPTQVGRKINNEITKSNEKTQTRLVELERRFNNLGNN